ncbi:PQ loop repeat-domain-containing protein [Spinellus fusiger]|nr:PQ loop repeat-domain-containing protein [Spinellus fusiger]
MTQVAAIDRVELNVERIYFTPFCLSSFLSFLHSPTMLTLSSEIGSNLCGAISILCWIVVFTPQLFENYVRKNTDGVSLKFLMCWVLGDVFNLIGAILGNLMITMLLLALYYLMADGLLVSQVLYYRKNTAQVYRDDEVSTLEETPLLSSSMERPTLSVKTRRIVRIFFVGSVLSMLFLLLGTATFFFWPNATDKIDYTQVDWVPQVLGWTSALLYCGGRIPQIMQNFRNESVEGLSMIMFLFSLCGNITYCLSIFLVSMNRTYLFINFPWLLGSGGTLFFDFMILFQFYTYKYKKTQLYHK